MGQRQLFELDSIEINKLPVYDITGDIVVEEVEDVELVFNYVNPKSSLGIDRLRVSLREMAPDVQQTYKLFIAHATTDIAGLIRKEFE